MGVSNSGQSTAAVFNEGAHWHAFWSTYKGDAVAVALIHQQ